MFKNLCFCPNVCLCSQQSLRIIQDVFLLSSLPVTELFYCKQNKYIYKPWWSTVSPPGLYCLIQTFVQSLRQKDGIMQHITHIRRVSLRQCLPALVFHCRLIEVSVLQLWFWIRYMRLNIVTEHYISLTIPCNNSSYPLSLRHIQVYSNLQRILYQIWLTGLWLPGGKEEISFSSFQRHVKVCWEKRNARHHVDLIIISIK